MTTTTDTEFAPLLLNGEPIITTVHMIEVGERLFIQEDAASPDCICRRCMLHEDFGGCIPDAAMFGMVLWMSDPITTCDPWE